MNNLTVILSVLIIIVIFIYYLTISVNKPTDIVLYTPTYVPTYEPTYAPTYAPYDITQYTPILTKINNNMHTWTKIANSVDGKIIAALSREGFYVSIDSGITWDTYTVSEIDPFFYTSVYIQQSDSSIMYITSYNEKFKGTIYKSIDTGQTWDIFTTSNTTIQNIAMSVDGSHIIYGTWIGSLWISTNSGLTWTEKLLDMPRKWLPLSVSANGNVMVAGETEIDQRIWLSVDSGTTWLPYTNELIHNWRSIICSADGTKIIGLGSITHPAEIYIGTITGSTLTMELLNKVQSWIMCTSSLDLTKIYAVDSNGAFWYSTNSGKLWNKTNYTIIRITDISCTPDGLNLFISEFGRYIYNGILT